MSSLVAIRTDYGGKIGSGHWVRTHTLADELAHRGHRVVFFARNQSEHKETPLSRHEVFWLPDFSIAQPPSIPASSALMHPDFMPMGEESDFNDFLSCLRDTNVSLDLIVTDHYGITANWQNRARAVSRRIAAIDDLADRQIEADLLLDQNFYCHQSTRYLDLIPKNTITLLGPGYALLRPAFAGAEIPLEMTMKSATDLAIVCFGGTQFGSLNLDVTEALLERTGFKVLVLGLPSPDLEFSWNQLRLRFPNRIDGPRFAENPASLFRDASFFVGSGGSITWERYALGLPGAVFAIAKNQECMSQDAAKAGLHLYLGTPTQFAPDRLVRAVQELSTPEVRLPMIKKMKNLVDGQGTARVADALERLMKQ